MKQKLKPIGFANGDGGTGRGAKLVREIIFGEFQTMDVPLTVEARLDTDDKCIAEAVKIFRLCGAGFKNSTASNDPRIKEKKWKSANIAMRPLAGAFGLLRMLQGPGKYPNLCGTLRYAHGGFYDEVSCVVEKKNGRRVATITQNMDLDDLYPFAKLGIKVAKGFDLHLILSSKSTIANSELLFRMEIEQVWGAAGLIAGEAKTKDGKIWTGDFHHELTDIAIASLPIVTAEGTPYANGKFLHVADNPTGDTGSDTVDLQHGNHVMGSRVYCIDENGEEFTYEELPGGTADGKTTGPLKGSQFLSPVGIIYGMTAAFEKVNPQKKPFFDKVRKLTLDYVLNTSKNERDTEVMINKIAEETSELAVA